jgi:TPR repeat protein
MSDDEHDELAPGAGDPEALLAAAVAGDPEAQYQWGRTLWMEAGTTVEYAEAYSWMLRAARKGVADAWWKLAICADDGIGCAAPDHELAIRLAEIGWRRTAAEHCANAVGDALANVGRFEEATHWHRIAAEAGDFDAMTTLGCAYHEGRGVERDDALAVHWYVRAVRAFEPDDVTAAYSNLGLSRKHGHGCRKDERKALWWFRRAARHGHEGAALRVAAAWIDGMGCEKRPELGRAELERLMVEHGIAEAGRELGSRLLEGDDLPQDVEDGLRWLRWAGEMGSADALTDLGVEYFNGRRVPRDVATAIELYREAAKQGDATASRNLGLCYRDGEGVMRDVTESVRLFEEAAERGDAMATLLAARHHLGECEDASPERAVALLRGAMFDGDADVLRLLASCLEEGTGCERDPGEAARLLAKADALDGGG